MEISELLMAKICHDLAGPVGAVNNGVEFLKEPGTILSKDSIDLIETSAKDALYRLLFFRQAYGTSRTKAGVALSVVKDLARNFYSNQDVTFAWPESQGDADTMNVLPNDFTRLLMNLILIIASTLMHGGKVTVKLKNQKTNFKIKLYATGKTVRTNELVNRILRGDYKNSEIEPKYVNAHIAYTLTKKLGGSITIESGEAENNLEFIEITAG